MIVIAFACIYESIANLFVFIHLQFNQIGSIAYSNKDEIKSKL